MKHMFAYLKYHPFRAEHRYSSNSNGTVTQTDGNEVVIKNLHPAGPFSSGASKKQTKMGQIMLKY